jgi:hypothetical protein
MALPRVAGYSVVTAGDAVRGRRRRGPTGAASGAVDPAETRLSARRRFPMVINRAPVTARAMVVANRIAIPAPVVARKSSPRRTKSPNTLPFSVLITVGSVTIPVVVGSVISAA